MAREKSFTLADEAAFHAVTQEGRIAGDALQLRINALPVRIRLEIYRRANAGEQLTVLVKEAESTNKPEEGNSNAC